MSPTSPRNLAASTGPTPNSPSELVLAWATAVLMRASTSAICCSRWRPSATSSVASCERITAGALAGVTQASSTAARLAVRLRRAPPGTRSTSSRVQPVDGLGARGHQVLTPLGQQVQHRRLVLDPDRPQGGDVAGGDGDRDRVGRVALATVADRQHPNPRGQLGRHVHHLFGVADQPLRQRPTEAVRAFHRPAPLRPLRSPATKGLVAVQGGGMRC
jgi:hypothetical protein